jgi:hypothetical protein
MQLEKGTIILYQDIIRVVVSYEHEVLFSCSPNEYIATELFDYGYSRSSSGYDIVKTPKKIKILGNINLNKQYDVAAQGILNKII